MILAGLLFFGIFILPINKRPYYILGGVLIFCCIGVLITTCIYGCKLVKGESNSDECILTENISKKIVVFSLWLFYFIVGGTFTGFSFIINMIHFLEGDKSAFSQGLIILSLYLPILCILTYCLYRKLKSNSEISNPQLANNQDNISMSNITSVNITNVNITNQITISNNNDLVPQTKPEKLLQSIPAYLVFFLTPLISIKYRITDTFYQRMNNVPNSKETKIQQESEESKNHTLEKPAETVLDTPTEREEKPTISKNYMDYLKNLRDTSIICLLCMDGTPNCVIMECGHGGICEKCSKKIIKNKSGCPMCRKDTSLILKIDRENRYGNFVKVVCNITIEEYQTFRNKI